VQVLGLVVACQLITWQHGLNLRPLSQSPPTGEDIMTCAGTRAGGSMASVSAHSLSLRPLVMK